MAKETPISFVSINRSARQAEEAEAATARATRRTPPAYYDPDEKSVYCRVKDWIVDLCFEKPVPERPIGLSQLSRRTFMATEAVPVSSSRGQMVQQQRVTQDYRFQQLINRHR